MAASTASVPLQHRPFAAALQPAHTNPAAVPAGTVRAEIQALLTRGTLDRQTGLDLLARLGLDPQPYRWAVALRVPVTTTVTAPNDRYALHTGVGHLVATLARLPSVYLTNPQTITAPTDQPARRSLHAVHCQRVQACPGYPTGGLYEITAQALLAVTVTADDPPTATARAHTRLTAELDEFAGIGATEFKTRLLGLRRLTDFPPGPDAA